MAREPSAFSRSFGKVRRETVDELIEKEGLKQISDSSAIEAVIDEVLANNAKMVEEFKAGKQKAFNALVGQAMKATRGKANPQASQRNPHQETQRMRIGLSEKSAPNAVVARRALFRPYAFGPPLEGGFLVCSAGASFLFGRIVCCAV